MQLSVAKKEGCGPAKESQGIPPAAFAQIQQPGTNLFPPWVLFTDPLGPAWVLLLLSAQITPSICTLLIAKGQTALPALSSFCSGPK